MQINHAPVFTKIIAYVNKYEQGTINFKCDNNLLVVGIDEIYFDCYSDNKSFNHNNSYSNHHHQLNESCSGGVLPPTLSTSCYCILSAMPSSLSCQPLKNWEKNESGDCDWTNECTNKCFDKKRTVKFCSCCCQFWIHY